MRILIFLSGMIAVVLIACSSSAPTENAPTPDIDATVEARAKELVAAQATEVATPIPTKEATVAPTSIPTKLPTMTPIPLPTMTLTPLPTMTPTPLPTQQPTITPTPLPFTGLWEYLETGDVMTDNVSRSLIAYAVSGESLYGERIPLVITCNAPTTHIVSIIWHDFIGLDSTEVTLRWDSKTAFSADWDLTAGGDITTLSGLGATWTVSDMLGHDQLIARVTPYLGSNLTAIFDLRGLEEAIKPLYEGCPDLDWS
jgi:hypothetical protein